MHAVNVQFVIPTRAVAATRPATVNVKTAIPAAAIVAYARRQINKKSNDKTFLNPQVIRNNYEDFDIDDQLWYPRFFQIDINVYNSLPDVEEL